MTLFQIWLVAAVLFVMLLIGGIVIGMRVERWNNSRERYRMRVVQVEQTVHDFESAMCRAVDNERRSFDGTITPAPMSGGSLSQEQIDSLCEALANIDDARTDCVPGTAVWRELDAVHRCVDVLVESMRTSN